MAPRTRAQRNADRRNVEALPEPSLPSASTSTVSATPGSPANDGAVISTSMADLTIGETPSAPLRSNPYVKQLVKELEAERQEREREREAERQEREREREAERQEKETMQQKHEQQLKDVIQQLNKVSLAQNAGAVTSAGRSTSCEKTEGMSMLHLFGKWFLRMLPLFGRMKQDLNRPRLTQLLFLSHEPTMTQIRQSKRNYSSGGGDCGPGSRAHQAFRY